MNLELMREFGRQDKFKELELSIRILTVNNTMKMKEKELTVPGTRTARLSKKLNIPAETLDSFFSIYQDNDIQSCCHGIGGCKDPDFPKTCTEICELLKPYIML